MHRTAIGQRCHAGQECASLDDFAEVGEVQRVYAFARMRRSIAAGRNSLLGLGDAHRLQGEVNSVNACPGLLQRRRGYPHLQHSLLTH